LQTRLNVIYYGVPLLKTYSEEQHTSSSTITSQECYMNNEPINCSNLNMNIVSSRIPANNANPKNKQKRGEK